MGVYPKASSLKQTLKKIHHLNMPQQGAELENISGNVQQAITACIKYASLGCKYDGLKLCVQVSTRLAKKW